MQVSIEQELGLDAVLAVEEYPAAILWNFWRSKRD
jgi:hypothetical protein